MKKSYIKVLPLLIAFAMLFAFSSLVLAADPYGRFNGSGTESDPFLLYSADDLMLLSNTLNTLIPQQDEWNLYNTAYYKLANDIDMDGYDWSPIANGSNRIFLGNFNGDGYTISNLTSVAPATGPASAYVKGLFGWMGGAVRNLTLSDVYFFSNPSGSGTGIGGVVGVFYTNGVIENCAVTGTLTTTTGNHLGGIVGIVVGSNARISGCSFIGSIIADTVDANYLGGIVGRVNQNGLTIENCYSGGIISRPGVGGANIGKIAGNIYGSSYTFTNDTTSMIKDATTASGGGVWKGYDGEEVTPAHTHNYVTDRLEATCLLHGYERVFCSVCGDELSSTILRATGHTEAAPQTVLATRAAVGSVTVACADCDAVLSQQVLPQLVVVSVSNLKFVSIAETAKNSKVWALTFSATLNCSDGSSEAVTYTINLSGSNANLDGKYAFGAGHDLAGYTLAFDIKGNGSNIKDFKLTK